MQADVPSPAASAVGTALVRVAAGGRLLLCLPHGGLNDTLCQIERCWRHARRFDRQLLLDMRHSALPGAFSDWFVPRSPAPRLLPLEAGADLSPLDTLACRPAGMQGRIAAHRAAYGRDLRNLVDAESGERLSFAFGEDHPEPLLLHEQCGGGPLGGALLQRVRLAPAVQAALAPRLAALPRDYIGLHVRNTDHRTDYETLFRQTRPRTEGRSVLVCSDDAAVIARARQVFDRATVITASDLPDTGNRPLHRRESHGSDQALAAAMLGALADLMALGQASELVFADVAAGYPSGFSRLAATLQADPDLHRALLAPAAQR